MPEDLLTYIGAFVAIVLAFLLFSWMRRSAEVRPSMTTQTTYTPPPPPKASAPVFHHTHGMPGETRVAVTHPMIRKAAERALQKGGDAAKFVERVGDTIYLKFDAIPDPAQRQRAVEMIQKIQNADKDGDGLGVMEMMSLLRQMFGK